MLEIPELWDRHQGVLQAWSEGNLGKINMCFRRYSWILLESSKFHHEPQILDMELQDLIFVLLHFSLAIVHPFLVMSYSSNLNMNVYLHYVL